MDGQKKASPPIKRTIKSDSTHLFEVMKENVDATFIYTHSSNVN